MPSSEGADDARGHFNTWDINDVVHQRTRLGLLAILREVHQADFSYLKSRLKLTDGNVTEAAKLLGISRRTLHRKINTYKMPTV